MFDFIKKRGFRKNSEKVNLDSNTDYRYIVADSPNDIKFESINFETNLEFIEAAIPDERSSDYRDSLIDANLNEYSKYLEVSELHTISQWERIQKGAKAQKARAEEEIQLINSINLDQLI